MRKVKFLTSVVPSNNNLSRNDERNTARLSVDSSIFGVPYILCIDLRMNNLKDWTRFNGRRVKTPG